MKIDNDPIDAKYFKPLNYTKIKNLKSSDIRDFSNLENIRTTINKMVKTCLVDQGVGLAAPQIGVLKNIIVARDPTTQEEHFATYINFYYEPIQSAGKTTEKEGCLSVPGKCYPIQRWNSIKASWQEIDFDTKEIISKTEEFHSYKARILQHEKDHILGKSIVEVWETQNKKSR